MQKGENFQEQLKDIAGQLNLNPQDFAAPVKNVGETRDFTKKARRIEIYEQAEALCMQKFPGIQVFYISISS